MAGLPSTLFWRRLDTAGAEHVVYSERGGFKARSTMVAATPIQFTARYEVVTDDGWNTVRCEVTSEGAGFLRSVRLERATGRWRVTASEQGNLDAVMLAAGHPRPAQPGSEEPGKLHQALDVDISFSPLTNTLPIRRLHLLDAGAGVGTSRSVVVAWILLPSLEVIESAQTYRVVGDHVFRFSSGDFSAEIDVDEQGYVMHYPGLAERA
jgi:uncharacterized protein